MDGRWWEPGFSLLEREVSDEHGEGQNEPYWIRLDLESLDELMSSLI